MACQSGKCFFRSQSRIEDDPTKRMAPDGGASCSSCCSNCRIASSQRSGESAAWVSAGRQNSNTVASPIRRGDVRRVATGCIFGNREDTKDTKEVLADADRQGPSIFPDASCETTTSARTRKRGAASQPRCEFEYADS